MYDDSWYSYVPDQNVEQIVNSSSQVNNLDKRESLTKKLDDEANDAESINSSPITGLRFNALSDLSIATPAKRSKSCSDFSEKKNTYLHEEEKSQRKQSISESFVDQNSLSDYFDEFEDDLIEQNLEQYKIHRDHLELSERYLEKLLVDTTSSLDHLSIISKSFRSIDSKTKYFKAQCGEYLADQKHLTNLTDQVGTALQYYAYLEPFMRRLNATGSSRIVTGEGFLDMLLNLNSCIEFMDLNPNYRDALIYKTRYLSLLDRSLKLVFNFFSSTIKDITDEVTKEVRLKDHNETYEYILLFARFEPIQTRLGTQIERLLKTENFVFGKKGDKTPIMSCALRYHDLWSQIVDVYISNRELVAEVVSKNLKKFIATENPDTEFEVFARHAIQYVSDICYNEQALILRNFQHGPLLVEYGPLPGWNKNSNYAGRLQENVLSHFKILHSHIYPFLDNNLERTTNLVTWLETMYFASNEEEHDIETSHSDRIKIGQAYLRNFLWKSLDEIFVKTAMELEHYKPSQEDLRISSALTCQANTISVEPNADSKSDNFHYTNLTSTAYPTVKTAVKLLIMYNDGLPERQRNSEVLYEIVHQTTKSLQVAATIIKRSSNMMDAQLFLIRNLMLIENLFMMNEIPDSVRQATELDFSPIWSTISQLQAQKKLYNPLALIKPLVQGKLLPTVVDRILDARKEMERVLVQQITSFAQTWQTKLNEQDIGVREKVEKDLEKLLNETFEDEIIRAALRKMIGAKSNK